MFPELFLEWIEHQRTSLESRGIRVSEISRNPDWNVTARLHTVTAQLETKTYLADITVWRVGHCELGLININDESVWYDSVVLSINEEHPFEDDSRRLVTIQKQEDFFRFLNPFMERLIASPAQGDHK